jgi:hypothetical protein
MGLALNPQATNISFLNVGVNNIYVARNRAVTNVDYVLLPTGGTALRVSSQTAATLRFIADNAATDMNVQQMGDE